jgi:hypothetical protein
MELNSRDAEYEDAAVGPDGGGYLNRSAVLKSPEWAAGVAKSAERGGILSRG